MTASFVHLHLHSEYSLVDGIIRLATLVNQVSKMAMPAVAITDQSNLFAMVKFYRACQAKGIKPIIGLDAWLRNEKDSEQPYRIILLCKNMIGYRNLTHLISQSYLKGQHRGIPMIEREWISDHSEGLIAIGNSRESDIARAILANKESVAKNYLDYWQKTFPNSFYLELCHTGRNQELEYFDAAVQFAIKTKTAVIATNDVRFMQASDFESHEVRVCICEGRALDDNRRSKNYSEQQYLRSAEEMQQLFAEIPQALANTVEIAKRCNLTLELDKNYLPKFPVPKSQTESEYLRQESFIGLEKRYQQFEKQNYKIEDQGSSKQEYKERLEFELDVIEQMGFPGYFLIVSDFISWAKNNKIPVGPGRGSGAGSLVAYALGITDLDPIRYELLFERFLNPERVSMPDFDVDFCMDRRDDVIDYVARQYGRDKVAQIITYGTMAAKAVVRDVGRVMGHPYGFVDRIAKLIPFEIGITLSKALDQEEELAKLYKQDDEVKTLIDMAQSLEGVARNAGKHAGGVVIAPSQLTDFSPLYCEQDAKSIVTQFDKNDVEAVGLVKFDFLGLRTLTIIDWAIQSINEKKAKDKKDIDIAYIDIDDAVVYDLLKRSQTTAVFQLESRGMKDLIKRLQPDNFNDIVALVALFRPGPLQSGMVDDFIDRKHGRAEVVYPHPVLEPILKPTYGVILYQEQVMQIAQDLAGFTLGGADLLRRAMGKKKAEEMAKQRSKFVSGAVNNKIDKKLASSIFDLMEKFAGYGFNKSHSAAYALVSYQTAWLKTHYSAFFMAAVLSSDMDNTDKIVNLIEECREMRLHVYSPDLNHSQYRFNVTNDKDQNERSIRYGLGAIKGVGQAAIECILEERATGGLFKSLLEFCQRVETRKVNRRTVESLIKAGAADSLFGSRAGLMGNLSNALKAADQHQKNISSGHVDLFGDSDAEDQTIQIPMKEFKDWSEETRLTAEKDTLGLYLTGHPITQYEKELSQFTSGRIGELVVNHGENNDIEMEAVTSEFNEKMVTVAGLLIAIRIINTRRGRMAILTLDDRTARIDITVFSEAFEAYQQQIVKDKVLIVAGKLGLDSYSGGFRVTAEKLYSVEDARSNFGQGLVVKLDHMQGQQGAIQNLASILSHYKNGRCPVWVSYQSNDAKAQIPLGNEWSVNPCDELLSRLKDLAGEKSVWVEYKTNENGVSLPIS